MNRVSSNLTQVLLAVAIGLLLCCFCQEAWGQAPGPTPNPAEYETVQQELADWWGWCLRHPNVVMRPSRDSVAVGRGRCGMITEEKLKVTGALSGRPPFASMTRSQEVIEKKRDGWLVGLNLQGWSYQTSSSTNIGVGPPDEDLHEGVPE